MADLRITPGLTTTPPTPPVRNNQARAAQRAFFDAALGKTAATSPVSPVKSVQATTAAASSSAVGKLPSALPAEPPSRPLRPGSLLDIKV
jgi:hypothetical protein